ncbi:hypothetical protein CsSME_00020713 [Camellia sinensis var. sinensis]
MRVLSSVVISMLVVLLLFQPSIASRVLHEEHKGVGKNRDTMVMASLNRVPVPPSGPSGCTNIPGSNGPPCPFQEKNFAGDALPHASTYPRLMARFGVAT